MQSFGSVDNPPALIFSDLDGTLLDHDSYTFGAAQCALRAVRERSIPLILATSKTLAETVRINEPIQGLDRLLRSEIVRG